MLLVFSIFLVRLKSTCVLALPAGKVGIVICVWTVALISARLVNDRAQYHNPVRPPRVLAVLPLNGSVCPRLSRVYKSLSTEEQSSDLISGLRIFDSHNNNVYLFLTRVYKEPDGKEIVNSITIKTVKRFPLQVIGKALWDIAKYCAPNLMFPLESARIPKESNPSELSISRNVTIKSAGFTNIVLILSSILFLAGQLPAAMLAARRLTACDAPCQLLALLSGPVHCCQCDIVWQFLNGR